MNADKRGFLTERTLRRREKIHPRITRVFTNSIHARTPRRRAHEARNGTPHIVPYYYRNHGLLTSSPTARPGKDGDRETWGIRARRPAGSIRPRSDPQWIHG